MQTTLENFFQQNENIEYHYPKNENPSKDWIVNESNIPYLSLHLTDVHHAVMLQEAQSLDHLFVPHRDSESHSGWSSLCIHGISSQHTDHFASYPEYAHLTNEQVPYTWTEIADRCPITVDFFKNRFPYDVYHRVRFMKLAPGGYITPHKDHTQICLCATNISLNNPKGCNFVFNNYGIIPFSDNGSIFYIANGIEHAVWNNSSIPRYHIIVHGYPTLKGKLFNDIILNSYKAIFHG